MSDSYTGPREKTHWFVIVYVCVREWKVSELTGGWCMYTSTHREGRDSKKQAAGQSRGRLRQRRHSQMQQIKTHARTSTHKPPSQRGNTLPWCSGHSGDKQCIQDEADIFRWLLSSRQHTWSRKRTSKRDHGGALKQAIWWGKQIHKAKGPIFEMDSNSATFLPIIHSNKAGEAGRLKTRLCKLGKNKYIHK